MGQALKKDDNHSLSNTQEFRISVSAKNNTTGQDVEKSELIQFVEFFPNGMKLRIPQRNCAHGHHMIFEISTSQIEDFEVTAKVTEVEKCPHVEGFDFVTLEFYQVDEKKWQALLKYFDEQQEELNSVLHKMR